MATNGYDRLSEIKKFDESKVGVKGLSDSGITRIPDIFVHSPAALTDLKSSSTGDASIPVVDLAALNFGDGGARRDLVDQVREVASTWGFFQVINHGVPTRVLEETVIALRRFHEQPPEVKAKHYAREETRGVMYASNNDLYRSEAASWHDSLTVWMAPNPALKEDIPEICRQEVAAWDGHATSVAETVMELLSEGLGLAPDKFSELTFSGARAFVGTCYPYCSEPDRTLGMTGHTDPGVVTVLLTNQVAGLQVRHGDEWVSVKPLPGGLIINIGDFLQIASNGEYKSVQHRVLANSSREPRISAVMFFNVAKWRGSGHYGPLPELLTPEKPAIYRDFTVQEFNDNFYGKGLDSKSLIQKIKL